MKKTSKIIVTIVAIVIFFFLFAVIVGVRGGAGHSTADFGDDHPGISAITTHLS